MILVDANLLLYAYDRGSDRHARAREWFESALASEEPVRFGLQVLLAFIRISTSTSVFRQPMPTTEAIETVRSWLNHPHAGIATPSDRHWQILSDVAEDGQVRGAHVMDAHLAALAIEHGAALATTDRGFRRFTKVRLSYPLDH